MFSFCYDYYFRISVYLRNKFHIMRILICSKYNKGTRTRYYYLLANDGINTRSVRPRLNYRPPVPFLGRLKPLA